MSESKHAPGPWVAADKAAWFRGQTHPDDGKIAITAGSGGVVANAYGRDNARLIAAAPDLYRELNMQVRNCPLCKGGGVTDQGSEHLFRLIVGQDVGEKVDCPRCKGARLALAKASLPSPTQG